MTIQGAIQRGVWVDEVPGAVFDGVRTQDADKAAHDALTAVALLLDEAATADRANPEIERMYRFAAACVRHRIPRVVRNRDKIIADGGSGQ